MIGWWVAAVLAVAGPGGRADKRALYGDPALVPTRAGERAREELALAAAVAAAVAARSGGRAPVVEVRLPADADAGAVVVAGTVGMAPEAVVAVAEAVVGPWSAGRVVVFVGDDAGAAAPAAGHAGAAVPWALGLALVGFGASAGIAFERVRRRG